MFEKVHFNFEPTLSSEDQNLQYKPKDLRPGCFSIWRECFQVVLDKRLIVSCLEYRMSTVWKTKELAILLC